MLPQRLDVTDLEAGLLQPGNGGTDRGELAVREDVAVDEGAGAVRFSGMVGAAGDLVVEQPAAGHEQPVQTLGVDAVLLGADVLGHPDAGDRVERPVGDLPVVLEPDLDPVGQAGLLQPGAGQRDLLPGDGDADGGDAVVRGRVQQQRSPAAADVQQSHSGP